MSGIVIPFPTRPSGGLVDSNGAPLVRYSPELLELMSVAARTHQELQGLGMLPPDGTPGPRWTPEQRQFLDGLLIERQLTGSIYAPEGVDREALTNELRLYCRYRSFLDAPREAS